MDSALIISHSEKSIVYLTEILNQVSLSAITALSNAGEARRLLIEKDFDLCIINAPLPDEFGESLARNIAAKGISQVILIVKADLYDEITEKTEDYGVITIAKPIHKPLLWSALKMANATNTKMRAMQSENNKLLQKIEDIRMIDRAKCILISQLSMSEPEAHRYIEKQAMDMRLTRRDIAEEILKTYEI
ncbi:MAG: ANTAR domain-containing protein [Oscillospiraceae bacterium]|jgi:response regulator NasT|nr:ANTAR domain-containing protein [Oscillospiraceae bacterium]